MHQLFGMMHTSSHFHALLYGRYLFWVSCGESALTLVTITYSKGRPGPEAFFIHPSVPSSIHGWHHTGKKTLAEINNPALCACVAVLERHARPRSPVFYHGQLYVAMSRVTSSANVKIFSGQGPDGYMRNAVYREVLEM